MGVSSSAVQGVSGRLIHLLCIVATSRSPYAGSRKQKPKKAIGQSNDLYQL